MTPPSSTEQASTETPGTDAPPGGAKSTGGVVVAARRRNTGWIRRRRTGVLFGLAMAVALVVVLAFQSTQQGDNQELSIRNPGPQGAGQQPQSSVRKASQLNRQRRLRKLWQRRVQAATEGPAPRSWSTTSAGSLLPNGSAGCCQRLTGWWWSRRAWPH